MYAMSTLKSKRPSNTAPKASSQYHHGDLRSALVNAGMQLLQAGNSTDFSLREAARAVGVTVNATYRHFANKQDLITAISAEGFRQFTVALMTGAQHGTNPKERLLGSGHAYVDFARQHPALFRLMFGRASVSSTPTIDASLTSSKAAEELTAAGTNAFNALKSGVAALRNESIESESVVLASIKAWSLAHGLCHLILDGQLDEHAVGFDQMIDDVLRSYAE